MNAFLYAEIPFNATSEINTLAFYMMFSLSISLLIAYAWYQMMIATSLGIISQVAVYLLRAIHLPVPQGNPLQSALVTSLILIVLYGFFAILLQRLNKDIIKIADKESMTN